MQKQIPCLYPSLSAMVVVILISFTICLIAKQVIAQTSLPINESYHFITKWGSEGSAEAQFNNPIDIAID
jgi:hypothetical protein